MQKSFIVFAALFLFASCENFLTEGDMNNSGKYPANIGHEWEYNTTWKLEFYDTLGHIDSSSFENFGNTIVRVTKERDAVGTYTNLIRFEDYDVSTPTNIHKMWYMNNDSGLFAIAYSNPGASQPVVPKQKTLSLEQLKDRVKSFGILPNTINIHNNSSTISDSIQYYSPLRKVLSYPLRIGSRWVELTVPFYRERFINQQKVININGKSFYCYKIGASWSLSNLEFNDYVDLNSGLIQREIISDSMMITTVTNPDSGTYVKSITISKLVRERK